MHFLHLSYDLQSHSNQVVCAGGNWGGNNFQCTSVDCGLPDIGYARIDCPDGTDYGSRCKFECRLPARRIGIYMYIKIIVM